jgi:hypothetical protein
MRENRVKSGAFVSIIAGCFALTAAAYGDTSTPLRPGLWRITTTVALVPGRVGTNDMCMDRATERRLITSTSEKPPENCSRYDRTFTATGATVDTVCSMQGMTSTTHRVVTYVSDTAYAVNIRAASTRPNTQPYEATIVSHAKWQGPCPASMKPGDMTQATVTH